MSFNEIFNLCSGFVYQTFIVNFMFFQIVEDDFQCNVELDVKNIWDDDQLMASRQSYGNAKTAKMREQPWSWMGSVRTGLNEKGEQIGPKHEGHPTLQEP